MRKWCGWYLTGFAGAAIARRALCQTTTLAEMDAILATLDPTQPYPLAVLRTSVAKDGRVQRVTLPAGYLDDRDDDTPPISTDEILEAATHGG